MWRNLWMLPKWGAHITRWILRSGRKYMFYFTFYFSLPSFSYTQKCCAILPTAEFEPQHWAKLFLFILINPLSINSWKSKCFIHHAKTTLELSANSVSEFIGIYLTFQRRVSSAGKDNWMTEHCLSDCANRLHPQRTCLVWFCLKDFKQKIEHRQWSHFKKKKFTFIFHCPSI